VNCEAPPRRPHSSRDPLQSAPFARYLQFATRTTAVATRPRLPSSSPTKLVPRVLGAVHRINLLLHLSSIRGHRQRCPMPTHPRCGPAVTHTRRTSPRIARARALSLPCALAEVHTVAPVLANALWALVPVPSSCAAFPCHCSRRTRQICARTRTHAYISRAV
jgi:hypothetical protein